MHDGWIANAHVDDERPFKCQIRTGLRGCGGAARVLRGRGRCCPAPRVGRRARGGGGENNFFVAIRAPSASAWSFAHTILGWISLEFAKFAKPQSEPAITFSRPTILAKRQMRCATNSGCSTSTVELEMTPGMSTAPAGNFTFSHTCHSCSWRGFAASNENAPA